MENITTKAVAGITLDATTTTAPVEETMALSMGVSVSA